MLPLFILDQELKVRNLPENIKEQVQSSLCLDNPKWLENQRMGRWNGRTPEKLFFYEETKNGTLILPRGFTRRLMLMLRRQGYSWKLEDKRLFLPEIEFNFKGILKGFQKRAVDKMSSKEFGTLSAPTGSGKTVMALALIARRKQATLIVVHTRELAQQWKERIAEFLDIEEKEIGMIGGGKFSLGEKITIALVQTLIKNLAEVSPHIGHIIVDECHRAPSKTFTEAVSAFPARYCLGLSATLFRRDKLSKLIFLYLGDAHHVIEKKKLVNSGDILAASLIFRATDFIPMHDPALAYAKMMQELVTDKKRNHMIAEDVAEQHLANPDSFSLILSDRRQHCETLYALLRFKHKIESELLTGKLSGAQREKVLENLKTGRIRVLVATGQLVGEGFDFKALSTLFLATPIRFSGRLIQYLGRILRSAPGKKEALVYDYIDVHSKVLLSMARHRLHVYGEEKNKAAFEKILKY